MIPPAKLAFKNVYSFQYCMKLLISSNFSCTSYYNHFIFSQFHFWTNIYFPKIFVNLNIITSLFSSVQSLSHVQLFVTPWTEACQASLSITMDMDSNSCPLIQWYHPTISSSILPFSYHLQSFLVSGSFQMSQFFTSGDQNIGVSASTSVLPMNTQDWSPLGCTGWISLQSKGLSGVFSNTTVQKHQFLGAQLSL